MAYYISLYLSLFSHSYSSKINHKKTCTGFGLNRIHCSTCGIVFFSVSKMTSTYTLLYVFPSSKRGMAGLCQLIVPVTLTNPKMGQNFMVFGFLHPKISKFWNFLQCLHSPRHSASNHTSHIPVAPLISEQWHINWSCFVKSAELILCSTNSAWVRNWFYYIRGVRNRKFPHKILLHIISPKYGGMLNSKYSPFGAIFKNLIFY